LEAEESAAKALSVKLEQTLTACKLSLANKANMLGALAGGRIRQQAVDAGLSFDGEITMQDQIKAMVVAEFAAREANSLSNHAERVVAKASPALPPLATRGIAVQPVNPFQMITPVPKPLSLEDRRRMVAEKASLLESAPRVAVDDVPVDKFNRPLAPNPNLAKEKVGAK
jgi:hypothetical protein